MGRIVVLALFLSGSSLFAESKIFTGKLDARGRAQLVYKVSQNGPFFLQAFVLYKKHWRSMKVFWNNRIIWIDMGPDFKGLKYRVHYYKP